MKLYVFFPDSTKSITWYVFVPYWAIKIIENE